jgi:FkbM family methyltransferase
MNPIVFFYAIAKKNRWMEKRLIWRVYHYLENLVRDRFFRVRYINGSSVYICPTHSSGLTVLLEGVHEPEIVQIIQHFVRRGFAYIDIGANIGLHTIAASSVCVGEDQLVCAFEPEDANFEVLEKNIKTNRYETTKCVKAAVGDVSGMKKFYLSSTKNKGKHSFVQRDETLDLDYQVEVTTLDEFFRENKSEVPSSALIKIDVEGFEFFTMSGARQTFSEINEGVIVVELTPGDYKEFKDVSIRKVFELMANSGFKNVKVVNESQSPKDSTYLGGETVDLVFLKGGVWKEPGELLDDLMVDLEMVGGVEGLEAYYSARSIEKSKGRGDA